MKKSSKLGIILMAIVAILLVMNVVTTAQDLANGYDWMDMTTSERTGYIKGSVDTLVFVTGSDDLLVDRKEARTMAAMITQEYNDGIPLSRTVLQVIVNF